MVSNLCFNKKAYSTKKFSVSNCIWNFKLLTNIEPLALSDFQMLSFYVTQANDFSRGNYPNNTC